MASFLARALSLEPPDQPSGFVDVDAASVHASNIGAIYAAEITVGCSQTPKQYCPDQPVTRAQMASFLARALSLEPPDQPSGFVDVDAASVHASNIGAIYAAEITVGCSQTPKQYCPDQPVTRAQMASFLARALSLEPPDQPSGFVDVDAASVHASNIGAIYAAEITVGCSQTPKQYCPDQPVTRAQMASFLARALSLEPPDQQPA